MISAGIDIGAKTIKIVILKDGQVAAKNSMLAGFDLKESLKGIWADIESSSGFKPDHIDRIVATGLGRNDALFASQTMTEVSAAAKGGLALDASVRTIIDVGAEEGRAIRIDAEGRIMDFAINEKCAAGTGAFIEAMARTLEVTLEELGPLSLQSTQVVTMNAQCAVFAESELVTLIHSRTPKPDMARAIHDAIADRIVSLVRRVGVEPNVMLIGGLAKNIGFVTSLKRDLGHEVIVPEDPEFVGAYGAAIKAAEH